MRKYGKIWENVVKLEGNMEKHEKTWWHMRIYDKMRENVVKYEKHGKIWEKCGKIWKHVIYEKCGKIWKTW